MDFDTLLGQLEATRPELSDSLSLIREYHKQKQQASQEEVDVMPDRTEELMGIIDKQKQINRNLLQQYHRIENNCHLMMQQLDQLAMAIGACHQCWGDEPDCTYCRGKGKAGYFPPDPYLFETYIKPVLLRLKKP